MGFRRQAACLCLLVLSLQACAHGGMASPRSSSSQPLLIGVSIQNEQYPFYQAMLDAMYADISSHKYPYQLLVTNANTSSEQLAQVEDFISKGVDAIVLVPVDSQEVDPAILEANAASIPVFTADIRDETGEQRIAASITSDNVKGGDLAGALLCNARLGGRTILVLDQAGITSVQDRVRRFTRTVRGCRHSFPPDLNGGTSSDSAAKALKAALSEQRHLGAVFAVNDTMALGALRAINHAKCHHTLSGVIDVVGYDGSPEAIAAVGRGEILAEIVQYPQSLGSLTIEQIHDHFATRPLRLPTPVPVTIYRKGDPTPKPWTSSLPMAADSEGRKCD